MHHLRYCSANASEIGSVSMCGGATAAHTRLLMWHQPHTVNTTLRHLLPAVAPIVPNVQNTRSSLLCSAVQVPSQDMLEHLSRQRDMFVTQPGRPPPSSRQY